MHFQIFGADKHFPLDSNNEGKFLRRLHHQKVGKIFLGTMYLFFYIYSILQQKKYTSS